MAISSRRRLGTYLAAVVTFVLGAAFLSLEIREFADMIGRGATPQRSAFLSAFFTLVGCHGLHVAVGLIWLTVMMPKSQLRVFAPPCSAACSVFPCSGTRSTSSGLGYSRSFI
jgi:cytochrome o ubiquinol oxidase subunit 3